MTTRKSNLFATEDTGRDPLSEQVIGGAIEVHSHLGAGLLESAYRDCLVYELRERGLFVEREVPLAVQYKNLRIPNGYRMDLVIEKQLIVEIHARLVRITLDTVERQFQRGLKRLRVGLALLLFSAVLVAAATGALAQWR